jgi:hypothetical protein
MGPCQFPQIPRWVEGILVASVVDASEGYVPPLRYSKVRHEEAVICGSFADTPLVRPASLTASAFKRAI